MQNKLSLFLLACGFLASTPPVHGQPIELRPAALIEFEGSDSKYQVLERTTDLGTWTPAAPGFFSTSGTVRQFFPISGDQEFFRVVSNDVEDLQAELAPIRAAHNLPAMGCVVVQSGRIVAQGLVGVRKHGVAEPVTLHDHWHHGSTTKAMTAVLAAMLVEEGLISWTTRLADLFPEHAGTRNAGWDTVTLEMLLTNSSGAPTALTQNNIWTELWNHPGTPREQRLFLTQQVTALAPQFTPGSSYEYSNAGFSMAGAMLEKVANKPWEQLMHEYFFTSLGMTSGGFGVPATPRYIDHPWGHQFVGTTPTPVNPGPGADNPPGVGPGGTVKCSLVDYARYMAFMLGGARGASSILQPATFQKLFTPVNYDYAMGWQVVTRAWANGLAYTHSGSNTQWYTLVWLAPNRDWGVVVVTNIGGNPAATAASEAVTALITKYFP
jgi:CubicO group peptidase (beta-lactamase class C family)